MMYNYGYEHMSWGPESWVLGALALAAPFLLILILWTAFWKGLALWHAAQRGQYWWFIIIMFVNTLGILEIIYLFFVAKLTLNTLFTSDTGSHHDHHSHHTHHG
jgi:hypothetical protein